MINNLRRKYKFSFNRTPVTARRILPSRTSCHCFDCMPSSWMSVRVSGPKCQRGHWQHLRPAMPMDRHHGNSSHSTVQYCVCVCLCVSLGQIKSQKEALTNCMNRDNGGRKDTAGCELREFIILRVLLLFSQWRVILKVLSLSFLNMIITEEDHFTKWPESQPNLKSPLTKAYVTVLVRRLISMTKPSSCWQ